MRNCTTILLVIFVTTQAWAQDVQHVVTASESCAALAQAEAEARTTYSSQSNRRDQSGFSCKFYKKLCSWLPSCCDGWACDQRDNFCGEEEEATQIMAEAYPRFVDHMCRRAEQKCPPPSPQLQNKTCTPEQKSEKEKLEKQAKIINDENRKQAELTGSQPPEAKVICGKDLQSNIRKLTKNIQCPDPALIPVSSEVFDNCECEVRIESQSKEPLSQQSPSLASLKPEEQDMLKQKISKIDTKFKAGDASAWDDLKNLDNQFGKFAGTLGQIAVGKGTMSPDTSSQAFNTIDALMAENLAEKKSKMATEEGLAPTETTTSTSSFAGTSQKPSLQTMWDTQQKTEQREAWKKKAANKKNGISDNPLRGIFAQVSSRYTVKSQGFDQFLTTQKGKYSTLKPE